METGPDALRVRRAIPPDDARWIAEQHAGLYAAEHGFDPEAFGAYVAEPLSEALERAGPREHVWIAEEDGRRVGSIALVERTPHEAQLRWFLVLPRSRRRGTGARLLEVAIAFAQEQAYERIVLFTVRRLEDAARLYRRAGFRLTRAQPAQLWGCAVVEERYELDLG